MSDSEHQDSPELSSRALFIQTFITKHKDINLSFYKDSLESAIDEIKNAELTDERQMILLYLHSDFDSFSNEFCTVLTTKEWTNIPTKQYCFVIWNITDNNVCDVLKTNSSVFVISSSLAIVEHADNSTSLQYFPFNFTSKLNALNNLQPQEEREDVDSGEEISSERFQQLMYEYLGDRDFDSFEYDEHEYLKKKIYFAIYGLPDALEEDEAKQKNVEEIYNQIRSTNNRYCKWDDKIVVSFIYNCTESISSITSPMHPLPIFVVRKCKGINNPCRLFIDLDLRVYTSWKNYVRKNTLPRCKMVVPQNGKYTADLSGSVLLQTCKSPRCSRMAKIIQYTDIVVTVLAIISAITMVVSFIVPSLALPSGIVGVLCALYSIARSAGQIHDRRIHRLNMSFKNADARGAYLTILGNSIGIIGGALTRTVAMIAAKGIKIGKAVVTTVNAFNYAGMTTDFAGILNAIHAMQGSTKLDGLEILQFAFSILFFNNSVVNLVKTKGQFVQSEISQSMKVNLMNRPIHKTSGQTVTHLRNIHSNDVIKTLNNFTTNTSISKTISFSNHHGRITLNNVSVNIMRQTVVKFQGMYLPPSQYVTKIIQAKFLTDEENPELYIDILYRFPAPIKDIIIDLAKRLVQVLKEDNLSFNEVVKKLFPHSTYIAKILEVIILYFEDKFGMECQTSDSEDDNRESFFQIITDWKSLGCGMYVAFLGFDCYEHYPKQQRRKLEDYRHMVLV
ncbi:putative cognition [Trypoxylus dichotomus]